MGYKIVYGPEYHEGENAQSPYFRLRLLTAAFLLTGCLLARSFWPEGTALLREYLVPGAPTVTEQAFLDLMNDLHAGEPVGEAVTVFCRTVLENGTDITS